MAQERQGLSRRHFLRLSAATGIGLVVTACGAPTPEPESETSAPAAPATATTAPAAPQATTVPEATATSEPTMPETGGTLRYAETGDFDNLNPWRVAGVNAAMYEQVFSKLAWRDLDGNLHGDIAESWELSEDGISLTMTLKDNVQWHDGVPLTAQDFVTMFEYTKDEELLPDPSIEKQAGLFEPIESVEAPDDSTLVLTFKSPLPYYAEILDYWWAIRIDDRNDLAFMENLPVGTGPFRFAEFVPGQYSRYTRNDNYHIEGIPLVDEWRFDRLERVETLAANLESGAVGGIFNPSFADVNRLQQNERYWTLRTSGNILNIIVNTNLPPFDIKEVRQALSYSLNREAMVTSTTFGLAQATSSVFYSPASLAYREDLVHAYPFDLDRAATLLEEAGVSDLESDIHVTARWPQLEPSMLIWQSDLAKIGVTLNVHEVESARFSEIGGDGNLLGFGLHPWANGRTLLDPAIFMGTQSNYRGDPEFNRFGWVNEELEELVAQGASTLDEEERRTIYQRINEILTEELPMINIMTDPRTWVWDSTIEGASLGLIEFLRITEARVTG